MEHESFGLNRALDGKKFIQQSKASEKGKGGCTLMEKYQPLWLNVTYFLLTQISEGRGMGQRVCFY